MARILVTGATGFLGAALIPRLLDAGHDVVAYARRPEAVQPGVPVVQGDAIAGTGLDEALEGVDVAYYLIHSMEAGGAEAFDELERRAVDNFSEAAERAGVRRVLYLGGLVPVGKTPSRHLGSRLAVEERLLQAAPEAVAFRASLVVGAHGSSFGFLVRLVERAPVLPLPAWSRYRTQPIDERDVLSFLVAAATSDAVTGPLSLDIAGPDVLTYREVVLEIADALLIRRPTISLPFSVTPIAAPFVAAITGEEPEFIRPLMESLESDLLARDDRAAALFGVRLHRYAAAVEHALREWERSEPLRAR